jgi:hypothetical protein
LSNRINIYRVFFLVLLMTGCSLRGGSDTPGDQTQPIETITPTETPVDTPTPLVPVGVFITPTESDPDLVGTLNPLISTYLRDLGLRYQVLPTISAEDFKADDFEIVVILPPFPGLDAIAQASPETKFLAVGFNDIEPLENLSVLRSGGGAYDVQGFIAGYIAAMITTDWRVGVLSIQESDEALAAREGFQVGVKYYCGLCNPKYAPTGVNYVYPKYIDLPVDATDIEIEANVNFLVDRVVNTYYIVPQLGNDRIYRMLVGYQKKIIGPGSDFREEYRDYWVASLEYDLPAALEEFWPEFLTAETGIEGTPPLLLTDVNPDLLSPGKVMMVEKVLEDLTAGYIKTSFED